MPRGCIQLAAGASAAIDQGVDVPEAGMDLEGESWDTAPDLGAGEYAP